MQVRHTLRCRLVSTVLHCFHLRSRFLLLSLCPRGDQCELLPSTHIKSSLVPRFDAFCFWKQWSRSDINNGFDIFGLHEMTMLLNVQLGPFGCPKIAIVCIPFVRHFRPLVLNEIRRREICWNSSSGSWSVLRHHCRLLV